jgi:DNA repair exonuclease SbcCD nuclease subunit
MIDQLIKEQEVKRVWILGDIHFGVRANSLEWLDIQKDFFERYFIPTLEKHVRPGDVLVQVGDTFDNRQSINIRILSYAVDLFERLGKILPVHVIVGNHDIWAKKSNDVTSIDSLKWIPNVQIYTDCQTYNWHDKKILLMPWRRDSDHEIETLADHQDADIVFCHSEIAGAKLNSKVKNEHGVHINSYKNFTRVYSGHIHYRQEQGKALLVGTPYELTRSDRGNQKGFYLTDLETMEEKFFENHISPKFMKYNISQLYDMPLETFKGLIYNNFVDLYVPSQIAASNSLSKLINKIQGLSRRLEPNIYNDEDYIDKDFYDIDEIEEMYKNYNIMNLCNAYVDSMNHDDSMKLRLKEKLQQLYILCTHNYDVNQ